MGDDLAVAALKRKRAELAGRIEHAQAALNEMLADLGHLDATLRLFDPEIKIERIKTKAFAREADSTRPEVTLRMILDVMRRANAPLTAREIATRLLLERETDPADRKLLDQVLGRVAKALRQYRGRGGARSMAGAGQSLRWELARE